ncbi:MAG: sulfite exporter TauE/SafE family protein [Vulcanimicrobiaceae bacterium]
MNLGHEIALAGAAVVGGAINSVAGGGSFITFPTLIFTGVPPISANATNNTAMWVGVIGSARGYKEEVRTYRRLLWPAMIVSLVGAFLGALLLLRTPPAVFERLIPYLLLFATIVFAASPYFVRRHEDGARSHSPIQLAVQFAVSVYGGYFGAGMGILMLAILGFSALPNMNAMNAVKNVLSVVINGVALIPFVFARIIDWPQALLMAVFAVLGGYVGSRLFRLVPSNVTRMIVIAIGVSMTAYFFAKAFHS